MMHRSYFYSGKEVHFDRKNSHKAIVENQDLVTDMGTTSQIQNIRCNIFNTSLTKGYKSSNFVLSN